MEIHGKCYKHYGIQWVRTLKALANHVADALPLVNLGLLQKVLRDNKSCQPLDVISAELF